MKIPHINVNLKPSRCECPGRFLAVPLREQGHRDDCPAAPVLIPCHIPRSIHLTLSPRECNCITPGKHWPDCHARPVKIAATIGGATWETSEVDDAYETDARTGDEVFYTTAREEMVKRLARERWALVRALVLGRHCEPMAVHPTSKWPELSSQRDAVFAALCDMARAERAAHKAFLALPMDIRKSSIVGKSCGPVAADPEQTRVSSRLILEHYVDRLVEQVGVLP